ncbi:MAG: hypothetical protein HGB14_05435 [Anaerolineaceae bacterium]|nr:hypothetical protein [Anaerolineaceae bacterium]
MIVGSIGIIAWVGGMLTFCGGVYVRVAWVIGTTSDVMSIEVGLPEVEMGWG